MALLERHHSGAQTFVGTRHLLDVLVAAFPQFACFCQQGIALLTVRSFQLGRDLDLVPAVAPTPVSPAC